MIKKSYIIIVLITLLLGCSQDKTNESTTLKRDLDGTEIAFYLIKNPVDKVQIESEPFLTDKDIKIYKWNEHKLILNKDAYKKIPQDIPLTGRYFVVTVNKQRIYYGALWNPASSVASTTPIIFTPINNNESMVIKPSFSKDSFDNRSDKRIYKALKLLGKLEE